MYLQSLYNVRFFNIELFCKKNIKIEIAFPNGLVLKISLILEFLVENVSTVVSHFMVT